MNGIDFFLSMEEAPFQVLKFHRKTSGNVDGCRVYVYGPHKVERTEPFVLNGVKIDDGYDRVEALPGGFVLYEDRGDYGPCAMDKFSNGHRHSGYRMEADGSRTWLPNCGSWMAVKVAASALAAGYESHGSTARAVYWVARRDAAKKRKKAR
jgi:hypothetical protein